MTKLRTGIIGLGIGERHTMQPRPPNQLDSGVTEISFKEFDTVYQLTVSAALQHWTSAMQQEIGRHCYDWLPGRFDFGSYLRSSSIRFYKAFRSMTANGTRQRVCDIGGFWGVFPVTLKKLGFESVTMTEALKYYSNAFDDLFKFVEDHGVSIVDLDPFTKGKPLQSQFDFISAMAILEHYPHSPAPFMENVKAMLSEEGVLYIEVPNLANLFRRIRFLFGTSPLVAISTIYQSETPFVGHHHEYTRAELRQLSILSGMEILSEDSYNYSGFVQGSWRLALLTPLTLLLYVTCESTRECLSVVLKKRLASRAA
jgi:2-polyprenyl-3-methyl-5-hydroxy-6-metoxy-1,4-benzoquinol methylase